MSKFRFIFLIAIVLLTIGCRSRAAVLPTPTAAPTATVAPTPTPVPLPTAVPTTASTAEVQQPQPVAPTGPFSGTFEGTLNGDDNSSAPVTLMLAQDGTAVSGTITIGDGLFLDGGTCGATAVPVGSQSASGNVDNATPDHLDASATFMVQSFTITVDLDADLAADGQTMMAQATIDLPFLCGTDPVITGSFTRTG